jgi:hypothetical protein
MSWVKDTLRELLLPALALTILATLWVLANARASEEDLARGVPPAPLSLVQKAAAAAAASEDDEAADEHAALDTAPAAPLAVSAQR